MSTKQQAQSSTPAAAASQHKRIFNMVSGDKGGVGKSFTSLAMIDYLTTKGEKVVVIETDRSNPDVARMYRGSLKCYFIDLNTENGWMDLMDAVNSHPDASFVMSAPAGIGGALKSFLPSFKNFLVRYKTPVELVLWWVMNNQHDSVNLLADAEETYRPHFDQVRVVCNTHYSDNKPDGFTLWHESPLRVRMEKTGAATMYLRGLNLRVVSKLFHPQKIIPFADAVDMALGEQVGFTESERFKLQYWREQTANGFTDELARSFPGFNEIYPWTNADPSTVEQPPQGGVSAKS